MTSRKARRIDMMNAVAPRCGVLTCTGSITVSDAGEVRSFWTWEREPKSDARLDFMAVSRAVCAGRE